MKWILLLLLVIGILALVGIIKFHYTPGHETIDVNTQKLEQGSQEVLKGAEKVMKEAEQEFAKPNETKKPAEAQKSAEPAAPAEQSQTAPAAHPQTSAVQPTS